MSSLGQKVSSMLPGKSRGQLLIAPERMKPLAQSRNNPQLQMCRDESKIRCCKEHYCIGTWNVRSVNQGKLDMVKQAKLKQIKRCLLLGRKAMTNLDSVLKSKDNHFANKGLSSQSCGFSSSHVWTWEVDHEEGGAQKNWCFQTAVLEKTLESPLDYQFSSVAQSCRTLCYPMNRSTPGLPVHHQLPEFTQTHDHRVSYAIQPSHPWSSPSPPATNPSQHQSLFQWVNSSHEVAKVLEFQL